MQTGERRSSGEREWGREGRSGDTRYVLKVAAGSILRGAIYDDCLRTPHQEEGGRRLYPPVPFSHHERFIWQGFRSLHAHSTVGEVLAASRSNPTPQHQHRCPGAGATWSMRQGAVCGDMHLVSVSSVARVGPKLSGDKWRQEIQSGLLNVSDSPTETAH